MEKEQSNEASSAGAKKRRSAGKNTGGKKKKRRKKSKNRTSRVLRRMTSKEAAHFLPQALVPLVQSSFLDTKDMGHLLLRTNKAMTVAGLGEDEDSIWKPLCASYWSANKANSVLESLAPMSPKNCFRELAMMEDKKAFQGPRPLQYTPQDYVFIISIKEHETGKPILCQNIPGQDISTFFENGKATIMFEEPLYEMGFDRGRGQDVLANAVRNVQESGFAAIPFLYLRLYWAGTLHILRRSDQRMMRFMKHEGRVDRIEVDLDEDGREECDVESEPQIMCLPPGVASLYGKALFDHYGCDGGETGGFEIEFDLEWRKRKTDSVGVYGFYIYSRICKDRCHDFFWEVMEGKDVTAAHFVEAIME